MNPPLHAVALHLRQRAKSFTWLYSQYCFNVPATTLLALGICAAWHADARAGSLGVDQLHSSQSNSTLPTLKADAQDLQDWTTVDIETGTIPDAPQSQQIPSLEYEVSRTEEPTDEQEVNTEAIEMSTVSLPDLDALSDGNYVPTSPIVAPTDFRSAVSSSSVPIESVEAPVVAQRPAEQLELTPDSTTEADSPETLSTVSRSSQDLGNPLVQVQGVYTLQGDESSARGRVSASYAITPNVLVGGTVDVTTGNAFSDSPEEGIDLNELYVAVSPTELPNLRFVVGMLDLTSYFDRNSFAKDAATQFLNPVFQSNPALAAAGLGSRPAILLNWTVADPVEIKVAGFSSSRNLDDFALDGFAGEIGLRFDNFILRGTYITNRDAGQDDGFREIFGLARGSDFGIDSNDRESAYGINAEYFIPEINLGLFARYGWYENLEIDRGGSTFSLGFNLLDLFMPDDRLGLAYGRELSNDSLRQDRDDNYPDVWELFYDFRITPNLRAGVTLQSREQFSETIGGFRIRADFDSSDFGRLFR